MSSNYSGNPFGTQSPSPQPSPGSTPIIVVPADTDPNNVATMFNQQYKMTADNLAYLNHYPDGYFTFKSVTMDSTGGNVASSPVAGTLHVSATGSVAGNGNAIVNGTTYKDNTVIAWAFVDAVTPALRQAFNITSVARDGFNATGCFNLTLGSTMNSSSSWSCVAQQNMTVQSGGGAFFSLGHCSTVNGVLAAGPTLINQTTSFTVRTFDSSVSGATAGFLSNRDFFVVVYGK